MTYERGNERPVELRMSRHKARSLLNQLKVAIARHASFANPGPREQLTELEELLTQVFVDHAP